MTAKNSSSQNVTLPSKGSEDGWSALNLEMPARIPRTEFDAEYHWDLVRAVTGKEVDSDSKPEDKQQACRLFREAWNYDLLFNCLQIDDDFGSWHSDMGHAAYAAGGGDYNAKVRCPFTTAEQVLEFDLEQAWGQHEVGELVSRFENNYHNVKHDNPNLVNMTGVYFTCFTGLIYTFGWEMLLLAGGTDPQALGAVAERYTRWIEPYFKAMAKCSSPVLYCHDDIVWTSGAVFHPEWYRRYIFPSYRKLFKPLIEAGKKILYICDGDYSEFVQDVAGCGVHGFFFEPCMSLEMMAERFGKTHVLIGNVDTRTLLYGTNDDIRHQVKRCVRVGKKCPGYFMAISNMIPANTPVEKALYYNECYENLCRR